MKTNIKCPNCKSGKAILHDEGYSTIFRCSDCGFIGSYEDFV